MLNVVMMSVIMLSAIMLNAIMLSAILLSVVAPKYGLTTMNILPKLCVYAFTIFNYIWQLNIIAGRKQLTATSKTISGGTKRFQSPSGIKKYCFLHLFKFARAGAQTRDLLSFFYC
jgi:hypothetical protein